MNERLGKGSSHDCVLQGFKYLALAGLLALAACDEGADPLTSTSPGTISGVVTIEGMAASDVSVQLSSGQATTTNASGSYSFPEVRAGEYTVSVSGGPPDATFFPTSQAARVLSLAEVEVNFDGDFVRSSGIVGTVHAEGDAIEGVTVSIDGGMTTATDMEGAYSFSGLRAGMYAVTISGLDADLYTFVSTSQSVSVAVDESQSVNFDGDYVRTSGIVGTVQAAGTALEGVTVSIGGGVTTTTDASGAYGFADLTLGSYVVTISGFDADLYAFPSNSQSLSVALDESRSVNFDGFTNTKILGLVANDRDSDYNTLDVGEAFAGVTVNLIEDLDADGIIDTNEAVVRTTTTDAGGAYVFDGLREGSAWIVQALSTTDITVLRTMSVTGAVTNAIGPLTTSTTVGSGANLNQNNTRQVGNIDPPAQGDELPRWNYAINAGAPDGGNLAGGTGPNPLAGGLTTRPTHFVGLYSTGIVRGKIVDDNGVPVEGAVVSATRCNTAPTVPRSPIGTAAGCTTTHTAPSPWVFDTTTNADGEYSLTGLLEGVYEININATLAGFGTLVGFDRVAMNGDEVPLLAIIGPGDEATVPVYEVN